MFAYVWPIAALLCGAGLLLLGNGMFTTVLVLRGGAEGFGASMLGVMGSAYFFGFLVGGRVIPALVRRIGHIRTANFCCAAFAACVLLHVLHVHPLTWLALRVLEGMVLVGFYTVVESWLNATTTATRRGQVFAIYMAVNLLANALAQQGLHLAPVTSFTLFSLAAIFVCVSMLPISVTRLEQPHVPDLPRLKLRVLWAAAPVAVAGGVVSGIVMGAFWTLSPLYAARMGMDEREIARLVSFTILGGVILQFPVGKLSDRFDRRWVLCLTALAGGVAAVCMAVYGQSPQVFRVAAFLYGGAIFALYSIAAAHLIDRLPTEQTLSGSAMMLFLYGSGAALGPALTGWLMAVYGALAWPLLAAAVLALLAAFALYRTRVQENYVVDMVGQFVPMHTEVSASGLGMAVDSMDIDVSATAVSEAEAISPRG